MMEATHIAWDIHRCLGTKPDGRSCGYRFFDSSLTAGSVIRTRCPKCNAFTIVMVVRDNADRLALPVLNGGVTN